MVTLGTVGPGPVLTESQTKILNTLKAVARDTGSGAKRTAGEVADAFKIGLPALNLAAGSAKATGNVQGARYVASQAKSLADDLRTALRESGETLTGEGAKQLQAVAKQLNLLVVKAQVGLHHPQAQYANPASRRAAESELRETLTALKALEAQIGGKPAKSGIDIRA
jgi:hypothetical protein